MKNLLILFVIYLLSGRFGFGQVGINQDNSAPDPSAILDVSSSSKGFLPPRMTRAEMSTIFNPANGLLVYCIDCGPNESGAISLYMSGSWYILSVSCMNLLPPESGIHEPSVFQIVWNWKPVSGATGYKWNTVNDYTTAVDMQSDTTKVESNLCCNAIFNRYVWSYNALGKSTATLLSQSTLTCPSCEPDITVNHIAGTVAPVSKTVTYGIVNNIPGEPAKCWISRNLGASQQATVVWDGSEAAAGWYWQFNRKQGYQYISNRIPNSTWMTNIAEDVEWQSINDPCKIELGIEWRLPTASEWSNVHDAGGWNNWDGSWGSGLKLHAAGFLTDYDGSLVNRGAYATGRYWSSSQSSVDYASHLFFYGSENYLYAISKSHGFTVRCLHD